MNQQNKKKTVFLQLLAILCFSCLLTPINAQNNTNSPYTRFGYGQINDQCFSTSRAMGSTFMGMRSKQHINPGNPASFSELDSTTFLFEFGASILYSSYSDKDEYNSTTNGNIDYIAFQFPMTPWMGFSAGLMPYTMVGYEYQTVDSLTIPGQESDQYLYKNKYKGYGGMNQVYIGTSFDIYNKLALGINAYYIFGNVEHERSLEYTNINGTYKTYQNKELSLSSMNFRLGLQYHDVYKEKHAFTLGAIYEYQSELTGELNTITYGRDTTRTKATSLFELPMVLGAGINYQYNNKYTVALDYRLKKYSTAKYYGETNVLNDYQSLNLGFEYTRNITGRKFWDKVNWRLGANYQDSYIKMGNKDTYQYALTAGVGIPLRNALSTLNLNIEYGGIQSQAYTGLTENYIKFGINISLNETWFQKRQIR